MSKFQRFKLHLSGDEGILDDKDLVKDLADGDKSSELAVAEAKHRRAQNSYTTFLDNYEGRDDFVWSVVSKISAHAWRLAGPITTKAEFVNPEAANQHLSPKINRAIDNVIKDNKALLRGKTLKEEEAKTTLKKEIDFCIDYKKLNHNLVETGKQYEMLMRAWQVKNESSVARFKTQVKPYAAIYLLLASSIPAEYLIRVHDSPVRKQPVIKGAAGAGRAGPSIGG